MDASLPALTVYADAELFNVIGDIIFQQYPEFFSFGNEIVDFAVTAPPQVAFYTDRSPHNISVTVAAKLTFQDTTMFLRVVVFGCIHVRKGVLKVDNFLVRSSTGSQMFNALLNGTLGMALEHIAALFDGLRLPRLHDIFGSDLNALLLRAEVHAVDGGEPVLCLIASFGRSRRLHHPVPVHAGHQLNATSRGVGTMEAIVPEYAINSLLAWMVPRFTHRINEKRRWLFLVARLRGRIQVRRVRLRLQGKRSTVRATVRFRRLRAGAGFVGLAWVPLGIRRVKARIRGELRPEDNGRKGVFDITNVRKIAVSFGFGLLGVPLWVFQQLFDDALKPFNRKLRRRIRDAPPITVFTFEDTIHDIDLPVRMRFAVPDGLAFHTGSLSATVLVSPRPGLVDYASLPAADSTIGLTPVDSYHVERGQGRPIVFVHGWSLNLSYWDAQLDHFSDQYRTIAYDLRGMGRTDDGSLPYDLDRLTEDLRELLDKLGIVKPVLCGHSLGGTVILRYAFEFPDRFSALICADVPAPGVNPSIPLSSIRVDLEGLIQEASLSEKILAAAAPTFRDLFWSKGFQKNHPNVIDAWREQFIKNSLPALSTASLAQMTRLDLRDRLSALGVPSLVLRGSLDKAVSKQEAQDLTKELRAEFKTIRNAGHMSPVEKPTAVNAALADFLERYYPADES